MRLSRASGKASQRRHGVRRQRRRPAQRLRRERVLVLELLRAQRLEAGRIMARPGALPRVEELVHRHPAQHGGPSPQDFRLLFLGQSASTIGDRIVFVALALYVTEIGSPTDVGLVLSAHVIPLVAFLLVGGVWADRLPRHMLGLGAGWAFAIDAVTFLVSAAFLARLRPRRRGIAPQRRRMLDELREGWVAVRSRAWVWVTVAVFSLAILTRSRRSRCSADGAERYGTPAVFGVLSAAMGAGTILARCWASAGGRGIRCARRCSARSCGPPRTASSRSGSPSGCSGSSSSPPASGSRCSGSGGRRRSPSASRRTCSRA